LIYSSIANPGVDDYCLN